MFSLLSNSFYAHYNMYVYDYFKVINKLELENYETILQNNGIFFSKQMPLHEKNLPNAEHVTWPQVWLQSN